MIVFYNFKSVYNRHVIEISQSCKLIILLSFRSIIMLTSYCVTVNKKLGSSDESAQHRVTEV